MAGKAGAPTTVLMGCAVYMGAIKVPPGTRLVKQGWLNPAQGIAQYAYRHADTGTWYQVTTMYDARRPPPIAQRQYKLCEFVGSDCECAKGGTPQNMPMPR